MSHKAIFYPESRVAGFSDVDGTILFHTRVNALVDANSVVLDVGCGRGAYQDDEIPIRRDLRILKGKCRKVVGIDVDPEAAKNPYLDVFHLLEGPRWPIEDESIDLCVCDFVLEHVDDPDAFFSECRRVLRRGGYLCVRTANVRSYFGLLSRMIPNRHHAGLLSRVQRARKPEDVFPTVYRCNTPGVLRRFLQKHGFHSVVYAYEAEPSYLEFSRLFYGLGVLHQKYAPSALKISLFGFARKGVDFGDPADN